MRRGGEGKGAVLHGKHSSSAVSSGFVLGFATKRPHVCVSPLCVTVLCRRRSPVSAARSCSQPP
jgi:hypothetical protein